VRIGVSDETAPSEYLWELPAAEASRECGDHPVVFLFFITLELRVE
jgi:hypothetical protein